MSNDELHIDCDNHTGMKAVGVCEVCGKPVCGDCATSQGGKIFCDEFQHIKIYNDFLLFAYAETMFDAEIVVKNLQANNITAIWFNPKQYGLEKLPRLYVAKQSADTAVSVLQSLDLLDFINRNNVR